MPILSRLVLAATLLAGCTAEPDAAGAGARVYRSTCATCHQPDGQGVPGSFPPLHPEWIDGDAGRLIRLTLHGLRGPVTVDGVTYNGVMMPHGFLSDEQIAAVLTYVRREFGTPDSIHTADVAAVRAATGRRAPWTAEELREATGIPGTP